MSVDEPIRVRRHHDSSDCKVTYASVDGCPSDCDCSCHSDDSGVFLADDLGMPRR